MSYCNYCTLQAMKKYGKVTTKPNPAKDFPNGVDVFIKYDNQKEPVWAAWFAALPDHCKC